MKSKWKTIIIILAVVTLGIGVYASTVYSKRGVVDVQTGKVLKQDLTSVVTASGEIKPKNYINIGANALGILTKILVKEGDHVRKGQLVARIENVQPEAQVNSQKAAVNAAEADSNASEASLKVADENLRTQQALIDHAQADLDHAKLDFDRAQQLFKDQLLSKQDYDSKKAVYDADKAALVEQQTRLAQARSQREQQAAQLASSQRRVAQSKAVLAQYSDMLNKYDSYAPIDGVVTNLPVREGETVVPGVTNLAGSNIMTIADMSLITAEVRVDETDIVSVALDQKADITIDAIPNKTFKGHVIEIGDTAIVRSTGLAASESAVSSQEAKDFKVVVAMDNPPDEIRPGLSCTAKITTATRHQVLTIPIQALTIRQKGDLEVKPKNGGGALAATKVTPAEEKARKEEIQGVFVVTGGKAQFRKVDTGITGATDIEVLSGLKEGDEIVTGSYQVIRTLRNEAQVKVDNKSPLKQSA
ncbi:MAG TPA: efflux RND transporter periplasmic adaptor subunit [Bryobacteraceae bacterium]|nr:efflux RND transporter periplasmic adaptor subunit [Bryobacteraceae bacterium]